MKKRQKKKNLKKLFRQIQAVQWEHMMQVWKNIEPPKESFFMNFEVKK